MRAFGISKKNFDFCHFLIIRKNFGLLFQNCPSEIQQVWSCSSNRSDIDLDATKIKEVKSVMASIKLPETSIPQWANTISEDQWKEQLLVRIREIQNKNRDQGAM